MLLSLWLFKMLSYYFLSISLAVMIKNLESETSFYIASINKMMIIVLP